MYLVLLIIVIVLFLLFAYKNVERKCLLITQDTSYEAFEDEKINGISVLKVDCPPEHDCVSMFCKDYYMDRDNVSTCIINNCRRICGNNEDCFSDCSHTQNEN